MKIPRLYIYLLLTVLLSACGGEDEGREEEIRAHSDSPRAVRESREPPHEETAQGKGVILFLGNSLSAGLGVDEEAAFPHLIQERIDSLGWDYVVVNAGISGETTAGGLSRMDWVLKQPIEVLVLELGGNDGLRGISTKVTRNNLEQIIGKTRQAYPEAEIVLAGMQLPPNLGHEYTTAFREIYPELADEHDVHLIPFLLEGVGGVDHMMQRDGIHPNERGHRLVAENVWSVLEPILKETLEPQV